MISNRRSRTFLAVRDFSRLLLLLIVSTALLAVSSPALAMDRGIEQQVEAHGSQLVVRAEGSSVKVLPGDRWLVCTDGLWAELTDPELSEHLTSWRDPRRCVQRLVHEAYEAGGRDNITAVVVDVLK